MIQFHKFCTHTFVHWTQTNNRKPWVQGQVDQARKLVVFMHKGILFFCYLIIIYDGSKHMSMEPNHNLFQLRVFRKQIMRWAVVRGVLIRMCCRINTHRTKRKEVGCRWMITSANLMGSSGAKMAHKSCHLLCQNSSLLIALPWSVFGYWLCCQSCNLGQGLSESQELTTESCLQAAFPVAW